MPREIKRFCPKGHDKDATGRISGSDCRLCSNERAAARKKASRERQAAMGLNWKIIKKQREAAAADFKYAFRLPAAPLVEAMDRAIERMGEHNDQPGMPRKGINELSRLYADRFQVPERTAQRLFLRLRTQESVMIEQADQIAVFLGLHPMLIWPREWQESA